MRNYKKKPYVSFLKIIFRSTKAHSLHDGQVLKEFQRKTATNFTFLIPSRINIDECVFKNLLLISFVEILIFFPKKVFFESHFNRLLQVRERPQILAFFYPFIHAFGSKKEVQILIMG